METARDAYIYNFSKITAAANARAMVGNYQGAMQILEEHPEYTVDDATSRYSSNVRWDRELKNNLRRRKAVTYSISNIWTDSVSSIRQTVLLRRLRTREQTNTRWISIFPAV